MTDEQDFTNIDFVLGAVIAQIEDLSPDEQQWVLIRALASLIPDEPEDTREYHE